MESNPEVSLDLFPWLRVLKDGTIQRINGTDVVPAGLDSETDVLSKDILIIPETGVLARIYRPNFLQKDQKLPLVVYFHGGNFCIATVAEPKYHTSLNKLVAEANVLVLSVDYRLAPENPLPTAYEDSWDALKWLSSHVVGDGKEDWINDYVDFEQVFLAGDSAGANISHHLALRLNSDPGRVLKILGIGMIHPYFWGVNPIGSEVTDHFKKGMVDGWWKFLCRSDKGSDDPLINPFTDGSPDVSGLACERLLVVVAEKDILRDRGVLYYRKVVESGWRGKAELMETEGEDHVFHIFEPNSLKAKSLIKRLASFFNQGKNPVSVE